MSFVQPQHSPPQSPPHPSHLSKPSPTTKQTISRKLQRIDILLNLLYSRVTNDRSLTALFPYLSRNDAQNLVSNFTYVRHQQDTQEFKAHMTDKQLYRIYRHHYRAEQRLAETIRHLRTSASNSLLEQPSSSQLTQAIHDLENDTAHARTHYLQQVRSELNQMSHLYNTHQDFLYTHEFSQPQQITTMQSRCLAMKDEYDAEDLRNGRVLAKLDPINNAPQTSISGPEDWEHGLNDHHYEPQWTPPDPPRPPSPEQRHVAPRHRHRRYNSRRPPAHDQIRPRRHRRDTHALHASSTRPTRSRRKSSTPWAPDRTTPYYSNNEFASMPNLRRRPPSHRKEFSYDDAHLPYRGSAHHYANPESIDPFAKPYPHQSADAFGWKPPQGILSSQYYSDFAAAQRMKPVPPPPPSDPYAQEHQSMHSAYHADGAEFHNPAEERPGGGKRKKWDEWRYHNGLTSALFEDSDSGGVMHNIADMVKGRKGKHGIPHNPVEAVQLARNHPVKFMTKMVAGEVLPQAKRKAKKIEGILAHESKTSGQVGHVLSKVAKHSMPHGESSSHGMAGQVGKKLAKMTMESAMGGSSKHGGAGQIGGALAKVAKESLKHPGESSGGAGMISKVMNTLGAK